MSEKNPEYNPGLEFARRMYGPGEKGRWVSQRVDESTVRWTYVPPAESREPVKFGGSGLTLACDGSSGDARLEFHFADRLRRLFELFKQRQAKYGPTNIAKRGSAGILVRLDDKLARLDNAYAGRAGDMADETEEDAWSDVAVYATIALVCRDGNWPGCAEGEKS